MNKENLLELKRLLPTLSVEEAARVTELFNAGKKTGYATVDKPWNQFYEGIEKRDLFTGTTPYQGLIRANSGFHNEIALEYFGSKVSFGELIKRIDMVAKSLQEHGVKKGDFVTICSTTNPEVVYAFYAISKIGAIANVISPFFEPTELISRINECESKVVIMVDTFMPKFKDILNREKNKDVIVLPMMNSSILRFVKHDYRLDSRANESSWNMFVRDGKRREETLVDDYEPFKPQAMVYSSGTTGPSKGILLSVDSFQKLVNAYGNSGFDTSRLQTVYQNIPPWFSTGLSLGINFPLSFGVKVCSDPRFEHKAFVKNVLKYKPEYILTSTNMYQGFTFEEILDLLKGKNLSFLKYPVEGGEPLTEKDVRSIEEVFRKHGSSAKLLNGYGECECGATITTDITNHKFSNDASGIPLPGITTVGIFDDDRKELKYGQRGNIFAKTEIGMLEYFKKSSETEKFFFVDSNGSYWSQTGDIGYMNEDGSLVVLGRKSDFSIINGEKLYNFDVERAILSSTLVKMCEVQTHPDDDNRLVAHIVWENEIKQQIIDNPGCEKEYLTKLQEIILQVTNVPNSVPYSFCIRDNFPNAASGKRDSKQIKGNIDGLIEIGKPQMLIKK